jgi:hypothetical protein
MDDAWGIIGSELLVPDPVPASFSRLEAYEHDRALLLILGERLGVIRVAERSGFQRCGNISRLHVRFAESHSCKHRPPDAFDVVDPPSVGPEAK